jgi:hypothetical protein
VERAVDPVGELGVVEAVLAVNQLQGLQRHAERADRVPHPQARDPDVAAGERGRSAPRRRRPVALPGVDQAIHPAFRQQADQIDEAAQAARRERAAREAEDVDLVARQPVVGQEAIAVAHVLLEAASGQAVDQAVDAAAVGADAGIVEGDLGHPLPVDRRDRAHDPDHVGRMAVVRAVPGAIEADDQSLHHSQTPFPLCGNAAGAAWACNSG